MKTEIEILKEISLTEGRYNKEEILEQNKDNKLLKTILHFVYNPYIITGLSDKKMSKKVNKVGPIVELNTLMGAIDYVFVNNTGRDIDINIIQEFINSQPPETINIIKKIFTKSLKTGITAKTLNKIYGKGFIPEFNLMLAKDFFEHEHKIKGNFGITLKLDGNRMVIIIERGKAKSFTRSGRPYEGLEDIEKEIEDTGVQNMVFDGELLSDKEGSQHEVFTDTISRARTKKGNKKGLIFHIFDIIPLNEFRKGKSSENYEDRRSLLENFVREHKLKHCKLVKLLYWGNNKNEIGKHLQEAENVGLEGVMVNRDAPYMCKRTDTLLKVKYNKTIDLRVVGFEEGKGRHKGKLGRLNVSYKGNTVGVGGGFNDENREEIWDNKDKYINSIVEIKYFGESKNQQGELSLRFPIFIKFRFDKNEVSYE